MPSRQEPLDSLGMLSQAGWGGLWWEWLGLCRQGPRTHGPISQTQN